MSKELNVNREIAPWDYDPTYQALRPPSAHINSKTDSGSVSEPFGFELQKSEGANLIVGDESLRSIDRQLLPDPIGDSSTSLRLPESLERTG